MSLALKIKNFDNLRLLINKSPENTFLLVYFYRDGDVNTEYLTKLSRCVSRYGKKKTKLYMCDLQLYPGMCQTKDSTCLYNQGYKKIQFYGHVSQQILETSLKRFLE